MMGSGVARIERTVQANTDASAQRTVHNRPYALLVVGEATGAGSEASLAAAAKRPLNSPMLPASGQ
jgi:hypothetical protein